MTENVNQLNPYLTPLTKILIAEDDAGTRQLLRLLLESEGYDVMAVEDGGACLNLYPKFQPDLVLLDVLMPYIDGFDCCRAIRAQSDIPQAQIIMLTSLDDEQAVNEAVTAGASDYLTKPIHPAVLQQQIRRFIQQTQTQRQLEVAQHTLQQQLQQRNTQLEQVLEKLQETIAQLNKFNYLRADLLKYLSHNIRNPLNIILHSSELLQQLSTQTNEEQANYLHQIEQSVDVITDVLERLTTFDQLISEGHHFHPTPIDLTQLCQQVVDQWLPNLTSRYSLVFTYSGSGETVANLDSTLIQQALNELISNAIHYSPFGGAIRLQLYWLQDSLMLHLEDQGIGIPEAEKFQIFTPFYRASNTSNVAVTSTNIGLGLAIVQRVVALHQGNIALQSKLDRGTTVTIYLPHHPIS